MLTLFIYLTLISLGHLQMIKYQDIVPVYSENQPNSEQLSTSSRDTQKNTEFQIYDIQRNLTTTKMKNLKDVFSKYKKKNCLTDKSMYEEPHNKDVQSETKNEYLFKIQQKEVQLKVPIARYNFDNLKTYNDFQLNSDEGEDMKRSGPTAKHNSYDETKFDDFKSSRRFGHNVFNQNILSDELKTHNIDHNLRPGMTSETKSEKFEQPKDPNIIINSDGKDIAMININETSYEDDDPDEYRSSSRELEKLNNDIANQLRDPTKGLGISEMTKSLMIMKHPRVCYACSSISDSSCWTPNRFTSVKYCHEDHTSCLTKMFKDKDVRYITRDCGSACVPSTRLKYDFCTICHADLCNNGLSTHVEVIIIIIFVLIHFIFLF